VVTQENVVLSLSIEDALSRFLREESGQNENKNVENGIMLQAKAQKSDIRCHLCDMKGHKIKDCWSRQRSPQMYNDSHRKIHLNTRKNDNRGRGDVVLERVDVDFTVHGCWYVNSGASDHMTNEKSNGNGDKIKTTEMRDVKLHMLLAVLEKHLCQRCIVY
jgi:hypothetical protein